jgi:glycine/D-amino acid oxidase-like deaminating enzyme
VLHACGHEGAGIGLAPATARLVTDYLTGARRPDTVDEFTPLLPDRLVATGASHAGPTDPEEAR